MTAPGDTPEPYSARLARAHEAHRALVRELEQIIRERETATATLAEFKSFITELAKEYGPVAVRLALAGVFGL